MRSEHTTKSVPLIEILLSFTRVRITAKGEVGSLEVVSLR